MSLWISGYYGRHNVGDEAILASVINQIPKQVHPVVFSSDPLHTFRMHGVKSLLPPPVDFSTGRVGLWYGKGYWLKQGLGLLIERFRVTAHVYCGGGMINDHVPGRMVRQRAAINALARVGGSCPVALLAVGADSMTREHDRVATRALIEDDLTYCSVRDQPSYEALCALGIDPSRVHLAEDVVFSLEIPSLANPPVQSRVLGPIGVNLRPLFDERHNRNSTAKERKSYTDRCIELIGSLSRDFGPLILIPFGPDDFSFLEEVAAPSGIPVEPFSDDPMAVLTKITQCRAFIGMRYHAVVFSLLAAVPCVPLPYSPKVGSLCQEMGVCQELVTVGNGEEMPDTLFKVRDIKDILDNLMRNPQVTLQLYSDLIKRKRRAALDDIERCWNFLLKNKQC